MALMDSREPWDNNSSEADRWWQDYCRGEDIILTLAVKEGLIPDPFREESACRS